MHGINYDSPSKVTVKDVLHKLTTTPTTPAVLKGSIEFCTASDSGSSSSTGVIKVPTCGWVYY